MSLNHIHPTAVVDSDVMLGGNVTIGAGAIINGTVAIGENSVIQAHAVVTGDVHIGKDCLIGYGSVIGSDPQDLSFRSTTPSGVRLGNNNTIREHCTIHRSASENCYTQIGDTNYLMAGAHLAHDVQMGHRNILANNVMVAGHVQIADHVFLGGGSMFHQFIHVGSYVITQGRSGFGKDIPPYTMGVGVNFLAGLNVVGLRRAGMKPEVRREIQEAYKLVFRDGYNLTQALEIAEKRIWCPEAFMFFEAIRHCSKRGICRHLRREEADFEL